MTPRAIPIERDLIPLNDGLRTAILPGLNELSRLASQRGTPSLQTGLRVLSSLALTDMPLAHLCEIRKELEGLLSTEERDLIAPLRGQIMAQIQERLAQHRDPRNPLLPDRIIDHPLTAFPGSPWYLATFEHRDPTSGISAGPYDPHYALIRVPFHLVRDGQDFPRDYFLKRAFFEEVVPLVRIHSECELGDNQASQSRCDCGEQFRNAISLMEEEARETGRPGVFMYLRQEGRGTGLLPKVQALQRGDGRSGPEGRWVGVLDTSAAMLAEGHRDSEMRDFDFVARMAHGLGLRAIDLLTNNRRKLAAFNDNGIVARPVTLESEARTLENVGEFLWKLLTGYRITSQHLGPMFLEQITILREGGRIDDRIYNFMYLLKLIRQLEPDAYFPPEIAEALEGLDLPAPRGIEAVQASIFTERERRAK